MQVFAACDEMPACENRESLGAVEANFIPLIYIQVIPTAISTVAFVPGVGSRKHTKYLNTHTQTQSSKQKCCFGLMGTVSPSDFFFCDFFLKIPPTAGLVHVPPLPCPN